MELVHATADYLPSYVAALRRPLVGRQRARALALPEEKKGGLASVEPSAGRDNVASQKVIVGNGGAVVGCFRKPARYGGVEGLRYRILL